MLNQIEIGIYIYCSRENIYIFACMCITRDNLDKLFPKRHFQEIFKMYSQKINTFIGFETGKKECNQKRKSYSN